jgi:hypothetical protein
MKRYWLFTYGRYYPGGGMNDFAGQFDTVEEALAKLKERCADDDEAMHSAPEEIGHVVDMVDGLVIAYGKSSFGRDYRMTRKRVPIQELLRE